MEADFDIDQETDVLRLCDCHGQPQYRKTRGAREYWYCAVRRQEVQQKYNHSPKGVARRRARAIDRRSSGKATEYHRSSHLRRKFGLTLDEYDQLLQMQCGRCAICCTDDPAPYKQFTVDHDHVTGRVRGLLCGTCNAMLGQARDNVETLRAAIIYLGSDV